MRACSLVGDLDELGPLVNRVGSDSSSMDNMLELMVTGGIDLFRGVRMLIPPAWQNVETMDPDLRAFYEYNSMHMEPWDGPAGVVMTDGRYAVCLLDRNGLRPARWVTTTNGYITIASEIGVWDYKPEDVIAKGRVGPGQILADADRKVSDLYDLIHPNASDTLTVRSLFVIDPNKKIRLTITYPASTGRNFNEILRVIDSLQLTDSHKVATPANWQDGDEVVIVPSLKDEDEIKKRFPKGYRAVKPYLRLTPQPNK